MATLDNWKITNVTSMTDIDENGVEHIRVMFILPKRSVIKQ